MSLNGRELCLATTMLFTLACPIHAEVAKSLPVGAPIADGVLKIGARTSTLPPGGWKLAGRHAREVRITETRGGAEVFAAVANWIQAEGIKTPRPLINVRLVKYAGDEYMRASSWIDPTLFGSKAEAMATLKAAPEPLAQWARAYRAAVASALGKTSRTFQVPPLPTR